MVDHAGSILLIVAHTVEAGRSFIRSAGFGPAMALGRVRIVTEPHHLRGWRMGTPVYFPVRQRMPALSDAMLDALDVYRDSGRLRVLDDAEVAEFIKGVMG